MDLYRRLILALALSATAGATALAALLSVTWAPALTGGVLAGLFIAGAAGLARWVVAPLRALAATPGDGTAPDAHQVLERLAAMRARLQSLDMDQDHAVEARVTERVDGWQRANLALSLLYRAVMDDTGGATRPFLEKLLQDAAGEGFPPVAGAFWPDGTLFLTGTDDTPPEALRDRRAALSHPMVIHAGAHAWAGIPVPAHAGTAGAAPRLLIAAWPASAGPDEAALAALGAVARYLTVRDRASRAAAEPHHADAELALKADFLAHVSERLQAAMGAIGAFAAGQAAPRDADTLLARGGELLERITTLLDLADGRWRPAASPPRAVSVAQLVERVAAAHRGGAVTVRADAAARPVLTHPAPLSLAVEALLDEARRHAGDAELCLEARHAGTDDHPHALVTVRAETGAAVAPGLALALATRLARAHGGGLNHHTDRDGLLLTLTWPYPSQPEPAHRAA